MQLLFFIKKYLVWFFIAMLSHLCARASPKASFTYQKTVPYTLLKGKFFLYWGWNGSNYTTSNLSLKGSDYNFRIHNMKATDRQTPLSWTYINPATITIPQYNYRMGYFIRDKWSVSIGMDHMKYVMVAGQHATLSGSIEHLQAKYKGSLYHKYKISSDFLSFEHTDGLNNLNVETRYHNQLANWSLDKKNRGIAVSVFAGLGAGMMIPKTNARLFNQERHDAFHISGFDIHSVLGVQIDFWKHFFIASEFKMGYINMPSIRITSSKNDLAKQAFGYIQYNILFGAQFRFAK